MVSIGNTWTETDSAFYTGHYLAGEAYRYNVTQDPRALDNVLTVELHLIGDAGPKLVPAGTRVMSTPCRTSSS